MSEHEHAILGWKAIAEFFQVSERKMRGMKKELYGSGVIFYIRWGRPPRLRVGAFPSILLRWTILKTEQKEIL